MMVKRIARTKTRTRISIEYLPIEQVIPYRTNPRVINEDAVRVVRNSIREFQFLVPIVIDADNIVVAGHTRLLASKELGLTEVPCIRASHLSQEQLKAFRIIDNKTAEMAGWDFDLLPDEIRGCLSASDIQFTDYGFKQSELDCLDSMVADDCLSVDGLVTDNDRRRDSIRVPETVRFVCGEIFFSVPTSVYNEWIANIRSEANMDAEQVIACIKERLELQG